jgi:hypothetical protein
VQHGAPENVPDLHHARGDEDTHAQHEEHVGGLDPDEQLPAVHPIDNGPGVKGHGYKRQRMEQAVQPHEKGGASHLIDEPRLRKLLHPASDLGNDRSTPEEPKVTVSQRAKGTALD